MINEIILDNKLVLIKTDEIKIKKIAEEFTYKDSSKAMMGGSFDKRKIIPVCFLKKKKEYHWLYSGFLRQLLFLIKQNNWKFNFTDYRKIPLILPIENVANSIDGFELYDYQIDSLNVFLKNKIGIIKLPTSAGKTLIAAAILKAIEQPFLFLVNRKGLATQTYLEFQKMGLDCGICHSEQKIFKESMVATIGSVLKIQTLDKIKVLVLDECQRGNSKQFQNFFKSFLPPIRLGLSATPEGNTNFNFAKIRQFFGEVIYTVSAKELMDKKIIAKPIIFFIDNWVNSEYDWPSTEARQIVENEKRNGIIRDFVDTHKNKCILILVNRIEHGRNLEKMIEGSIYLDGSDSIKFRNEIKDKMETGEVKIVITTGIWNEGVSIKAIQVLINASARKSIIDTVQKLGRSLRIKEGKCKSIIIDFQDNGNYFLEKQSKKRRNTWIKEGFTDINNLSVVELLNLNVERILND